MRDAVCEVCGCGISKREAESFEMCAECFAEQEVSELGYGAVKDFMRDYRYEFVEFLKDNYSAAVY